MIFPTAPSRTRRSSSTLRILLMLILFVGVGYLFWVNFERSMQRIHTSDIVIDETQTIDQDVSREIISFSKNFQRRFGISIKVQVFKGFVISPSKDSRTVFIGLSPHYNESSAVFPPLLKRALPDDFVDYLQNEHFERYWDNEGWQEGVLDALGLIGKEMMKIERGE